MKEGPFVIFTEVGRTIIPAVKGEEVLIGKVVIKPCINRG